MDALSSTEGAVALGAAAGAVLAIVWSLVLSLRIRTLRRDQKLVLGSDERDLVEHAARIEQGFIELRDWVEETSTSIEARMGHAERRTDACVAHVAVVRYDAYGEMSGQQSSSIALLDAHRTGLVLSSILHRDSARVYVKQVTQGASEHELSPEENEVIEAALAGSPQPDPA